MPEKTTPQRNTKNILDHLKILVRNPYLYALLIGYYAVWVGWNFIRLPFVKHDEIISAITLMEYNPTNNIIRFIFAIIAPPLVCLLLWLILRNRQRFSKPSQRKIFSIFIVVISIMMCAFMGIVQNSTNPALNPEATYGGPYEYALVDTFHEGEVLGPAISYEQPSLAPYRDFVVVHGVFQDALRGVIAFDLFGHSIGAVRAFTVILGIITFMLYFVLLLVLFRGHIFKSALALSVLALLMLPSRTIPFFGELIYGVQLPFRDIATILFLIAAIVGLRFAKALRIRPLLITSLIIGFIVIVSYANSIDRALFISALSVVWLILIAFLMKLRQFVRISLLPYLVGILLGLPLLGVALKWAFGDFISYILTISKYKEFLDGIVFGQPNIATGIVLLSASAFVLWMGSILLNSITGQRPKNNLLRTKVTITLEGIRTVVRNYSVVILLIATSIFFLRSAVGRALPDHFVYSIQWLYLLIVFLFITYIYRNYTRLKLYLNFFVVMLLLIMTAFYAGNVKSIDIKSDTFPISMPDSSFMKTDYVDTADYLKKNLKADETFVTLTSEASWYYFVGKPSPVQYPVVWYAFTQPQREVIAIQIAENNKIKFIITNNNWTSNIDYVSNETRLPEVYKVLYEKYTPYKGIGQQTLWLRK